MPVAPASAFWDILDGLSQKHVDGFHFDYYKALRAAWLCVGLSGLFGEGAVLQGTHLLPLCSFGRGGAGRRCGTGPGPSQRRTGSTCLWRCQDPGYFPCTLGSGCCSAGFWRVLGTTCPSCMLWEPGMVLTPNECYRTPVRVGPVTPASSADKDP